MAFIGEKKKKSFEVQFFHISKAYFDNIQIQIKEHIIKAMFWRIKNSGQNFYFCRA